MPTGPKTSVARSISQYGLGELPWYYLPVIGFTARGSVVQTCSQSALLLMVSSERRMPEGLDQRCNARAAKTVEPVQAQIEHQCFHVLSSARIIAQLPLWRIGINPAFYPLRFERPAAELRRLVRFASCEAKRKPTLVVSMQSFASWQFVSDHYQRRPHGCWILAMQKSWQNILTSTHAGFSGS